MRNVSRLLSFFAFASLALAQREYDCGTLGQRACGWKDWEFYNMRWGTHKCEFDLKEVDGRCVEEKRFTRTEPTGWLRWAIKEQSYSIMMDQPINRIPWFGTHNAFSAIRQGFNSPLYTNHTVSITDQLNLGSRHLELDVHNYTIVDDSVGRLCHSGTAELCLIPGFGTRLFAFALREIAAWLRSHPEEVIIIKLDDKNVNARSANGMREMYAELEDFLGRFAYRPPTTFTRWPTMREIKMAQKQLVIMQHGNPVSGDGIGFAWNAKNYIQENNWPINQDLSNCVSDDGVDQANRRAVDWWDMAEGRTLANAPPIADQTGLITRPVVERAVRCGVSIIGVDYLGALNDSPIGTSLSPDTRLEGLVWSYAENDFGRNGPAALMPNGRWSSQSESLSKPFACAEKRTYGDANDVRNWRVTNFSGPWGSALGNSQCVAEFGANYEFAFPRNGYQNRRLMADVTSRNLTNGVWLDYSRNFSLIEIEASKDTFNFAHDPGALPPPAQSLLLYSRPGAQISAQNTAPWLIVDGLQSSVPMPDSWVLPVSLRLDPAALANLPSGNHTTTVVFRSTLNSGRAFISNTVPVVVNLNIRRASPLTITPERSSFEYNRNVVILTQFPANPNPARKGSLTLMQTNVADPLGTARDFLVQGASQSLSLPALAPGLYRFAVSYEGDENYLPSESNEIEFRVLPRIGVSPLAIQFNMAFGGAVPSAQSAAISNAASGLEILKPCGWLNPVLNSPTQLQLNLDSSQVSSLAPGLYPCDVTLRDSLSATGGSTLLPVTLRITTTFSAAPSGLSLFAGTDAVAREVVVSTPGNRSIPLQATSNQPWLDVFIPSEQAPTNIVVSARPTGLAPGTYQGVITLSSALAANPVVLPVSLTVLHESIVDTIPSGITVYVDGAPVVTPAKFLWPGGSQHQLALDTFQLASGSTTQRYRFSSWQHGGAQTQVVTTPPTGGASFTALYSTEFQLGLDALPNGSGTFGLSPTSVDGFYPANAQVQIQANPGLGKTFTGWTGDVPSGAGNPLTVTMNSAKAIVGRFSDVVPVNVNFTSNVPATILIDGAPYSIPATIPLVPGTNYLIAAPQEQNASATSRQVFQQWLRSSLLGNLVIATPSFTFSPTPLNVTLALTYTQQFFVAATASPASAGSVSGAGWFAAGATGQLSATANSGYTFSSFSGSLNATQSTINFGPLASPLNVVANFTASAQPLLSATTSGARSDGPLPGQRQVPIVIRNSGSGPAATAEIIGITNIRVMSGSGVVTNATPLPLALGDLSSNAQANANLIFNWPANATRVQFTVLFRANNGQYQNQSTLTLFR